VLHQTKEFSMKKTNQWIAALTVIMAMALFFGCQSSPTVSYRVSRNAAIDRATPIRTEPKKKPRWVDNPKSAETRQLMAITGSSGRYATATGDFGARNAAIVNGQNQLSNYYGVLIAEQVQTFSAQFGLAHETLSPQIVGRSLTERMSQAVVRGLKPSEYYTEVYIDNTHRESYQVYTLMVIEKELVKKAIDDWALGQANDFAQQAEKEQDRERKNQLEQVKNFFQDNFSSKLGF
jgi:hypothetical protein